MIWYSYIIFSISMPAILWMVLASVLNKFHWYWIYTFISLYLNIYNIHNKHDHGCLRKYIFCFVTFESLYLKYLHSSIEFMSSISNYMWPHLSDTYYILHVSWLIIWIVYFPSGMCWFSNYFENLQVLESTVSLLLIKSNKFQSV